MSKISYIDLNNKQDIINYINFCTNNFNKYMEPAEPDSELNFDEFDFPLTTEYNKYADGFKYKFISNTQ